MPLRKYRGGREIFMGKILKRINPISECLCVSTEEEGRYFCQNISESPFSHFPIRVHACTSRDSFQVKCAQFRTDSKVFERKHRTQGKQGCPLENCNCNFTEGFVDNSRRMNPNWLIALAVGIVCACGGAECLMLPMAFKSHHNSGSYLTQDEHWFSQRLDHYSPTDRRQFNQRYYEFLDYFQPPNGPIFLKLCGESSCNGIMNDYLGILAKKFGAALVSLEHRYYGKSSPFQYSTTDNLQYLSSKQALFDLASFHDYYQGVLNTKQNLSKNENSWFVFGVSYAGALSAWFRLKFPHLTCGSLASSAVVHAVYNFTDFDKQIGESAGPACKNALQEVTRLAEQGLSTNEKAVKSLFGAEKLNDDSDFLYLLADAAVTAIQYGSPDALCSPLIEANKTGQDLLSIYAEYVKKYFLGTFGARVESYDRRFLKSTIVSSETSDRLWWYQVCTELAYFQVAPSNDSIRSSKLDAKYHLDLCKSIFGKGIYPEVNITNLYYGGTNIAGSKIIFTNGSQDPWRHASKQKSSTDMPSYIITCHNCGHGTDIRGCPQSPLRLEGDASNCTSPDVVHKVRQQIIGHLDLWLSECLDKDRSFM